jgi:hypothetical protein
MSYQAVDYVLKHSKAQGAARVVMIVIAQKCHSGNKSFFCWVSLDDLGKLARVSERHLCRILGELERAGEIRRERSSGGYNRPSCYTIICGQNSDAQTRVNSDVQTRINGKTTLTPRPDETLTFVALNSDIHVRRNKNIRDKREYKSVATAPSNGSFWTVDDSFPKNGNRPAGRARQLEAFARFYEAYPKHVARDAAEKAWLKRNPDESTTAKIMAAVENQKRWRADHAGDPKMFIPEWKHPATWLSDGCWKDELGNNDQPRKERKFING